MTKEALTLALELKNSASAYWTKKEISIVKKLIDVLAQQEQPTLEQQLAKANADRNKAEAERDKADADLAKAAADWDKADADLAKTSAEVTRIEKLINKEKNT